MSYNYLPLDRKWLHFQQVKNLLDFDQLVSITFDAHERILHCRQYLDKKLQDDNQVIYGVNTGLGFLQDVKLDSLQLEALQHNLLMSHACGLGEHVPLPIVKLMLMLKIKSLSYGYSGVHIETVKRLMDMYNAGMFPVIYTQGSLGAGGDLAPLSHLSLPLIGLGRVWYNGEQRASADVLNELGWGKITLHSKEALALITGTQFTTAYGLYCLKQSEQLINMANAIAALAYDVFDCNPEPLHHKLQSIHPFAGQVKVAAELRAFLQNSELSKQPRPQIQDPSSFKCIPQVHGATADTFDHVLKVFMQEANSVTDAPNIFPDDDLVLSGGNSHGQQLALTLDFFAIAMSGLAGISERKTNQLVSGQRQLPLFLTQNSGLHSGYRILQQTAASLVSENRQLCTPASVNGISSNNFEDQISMGANAATKCLRVIDNVTKVLAIELMCSAQALEFKRPLHTSPVLEQMVANFKQIVPFSHADHVMHDDIIKAVDFVNNYVLPIQNL